jgi:hypothetical protein
MSDDSDSESDDSQADEVPETVLPEVFRGRMFCVTHGRQCYRRKAFAGDFVWVCPDERHSRPVAG